MSNDVEVPEDVLKELVDFADTHGMEYGGPTTYAAVRKGKSALGVDNTEPYFPWKESWGSD